MKSDVVRLIDANAALEQVARREKMCVPDKDGVKRVSIDSFCDFIRNRPTLDVEPVVHCRNCVFFNTMGENPKCDCTMALAGTLKESDYCSRGIRKE